jgi:dephospho-CoA kinase
MSKIIIGLAGEIASGKGTAAKYITEKYKGSSHRFSTMLRDVLDRLYIEETRENMANLSTMLRKTFGEDIIAKVMFHDVKNDESEIVAIDGVRRMADIKYLKELPKFKLVYIDASLENRYERIRMRGENPDDNKKTFEEFKKDHELETELQIKDLKNYADYAIDNNGDLTHLNEQIDKIVEGCKSIETK